MAVAEPAANVLLLSELLAARDADLAVGDPTAPQKPSKRTHMRVISITSVSTAASSEDAWASPAHNDDEVFDEDFPLKISTLELPQQLAPPVRWTFVDFPLERPVLRRIASAPGGLSLHEAPSPQPRRAQRRPAVLPQLIDAVGSSSVPTIGSLGHGGQRRRRCKPCAFFWKEAGCFGGPGCQFCHLCGPDEKKLRRKEKVSNQVRRRLAAEAQR